MNKKLLLYLWVCVTMCSCVATRNKNYTFNQKYSAAQVRQDINVLKEVYEANHPSLYWYTSKDSLNYFFDSITHTVTDSLTELEARKKLAAIISKIKCGHGSVSYSKQYLALADKHKYSQFPLLIKVWKDSMVTAGYYNTEDSLLKRGTIITAINGKNVQAICNNVFQYMSTDGEGNNFKYQQLSNNFPAWYKIAFGLDSVYRISYIDSNKTEQQTTIKWYYPTPVIVKKKDSTKIVAPIAKPAPKPTLSKRQIRLAKIRSYIIDTGLNTMFIKLNSFTGGNLKSFFSDCFNEIKEKNIANVVFDIRENTGGRVNNSIELLRYLKQGNLKIADSCYATNTNIKNKKYVKGWFGYWLLTSLSSRKMSDGLIHNRTYETHNFKPFKHAHFNGNLYIIQGGLTFSAATIFSSFLKGQSNVTIIGEETGGGFYGNTAMLIPNIYLPNTKLKVRLPLYRYIMDKARPKGNGVLPDIDVEPSSVAIKNGIDLKMQKVKELIFNVRSKY